MVLVALRACSAALVLFLLAEPAIQVVQTARVKNRLAVLVDTSRSMNVPVEPGGPTRAAAAAAFLQRNRGALERLSDRVQLEWYAFDREARPADAAALSAPARAAGGGTDLLGALEAVSRSGSGRRLAGVVVVSDGADHAALAAGVDDAARARLTALGAPVTTIAAGRDAPRDLAIERVAVDDFAFVRNTVTVEATITARGFDGDQVPVVLRREGAVVASRSVRVGDGAERVTVSLPFAPDQTGTMVLTVAAPVFPGEAVAENNTRSFVLRVIRDRVRVLFVAGRPSWDERFLRGILKQDPNVDLVSFYILRGPADRPGSQDDLSLIPFPVSEIFGEQLRTFDAVLFVNFAFQPYRSLDIERYLPGLRDYVRRGGALAMLGGEQSFGEARYAATPLADVLPVDATDGLGLAETPYRPRLTPEGRRHPVTALAPGDAANDAAWAALPELPMLNRTRPLPAATGARVLLEAPGTSADGRASPLLAVREIGAGRTLALATDSSWFWGFVAAEESGSPRSYERFWNNALRWLVKDPELAPVQVEPARPVVEPGEPAAVEVTVRGPDWSPAPGAPVTVELVADDGSVAARAEVAAGADGVAHAQFPDPAPGAYRIVARARTRCTADVPCPADAPAEVAAGAVAVRAAGAEDSDAAPRPALLQQLAEATGGARGTVDGALPELPLAEAERIEVGRRRDVPIWDRAIFLLALALTLGGEWLLRRRWGHA